MRDKIVITLFFTVWIALLVRVYYISIKSNKYYESLAQQNMLKKEWIVPVRGNIYDRLGNPLAVNKIGFKIKIAPHLNSTELHKAIDTIANALDLNSSKLYKTYVKYNSAYRHTNIEVVPFVPYAKMLPHFTQLNFEDNIFIDPAFKRYYPFKDVAAHVIGYVAKTNKKEAKKDKVAKVAGIIGKSGLEKYYNKYLEGKLGYKIVKIDAFNKELEIVKKVEPTENNDLHITLDLRLQKFIHKLFEEKAGVALVMRTDGAILAAGSFPEYNLNIFVRGVSKKEWKKIITDLNRPFTNKIVHGLYPPGSTIKMGVALAFLDAQKIFPQTNVFCSGEIELGTRKFRCWKKHGHGNVQLIKAIRESCDVYFYEGSLKVGIDKIAHDLRRFGFGKKSGVDLPNEFYGIVPDRAWKRKKYNQPWFQGETLVCAIGQGYDLVTPMQIARYTALMATAKLPTPYFNSKKKPKVEDVLTPLQKNMLPLIQRGMYEVCNMPHGTAYWSLRSVPLVIAGKTGTAQVVSIPQDQKERLKEEELAYFERSHAWLTTYAPYRDPKYIVTVLVEHGGHGGSAAGPIVAKIYKKMIQLGYFTQRDMQQKRLK